MALAHLQPDVVRRVSARAWLGLAGALPLLGACHGSPADTSPPARSCSIVVWHHPASPTASVEVVGDWNDWARPGLPMNVTGDPGWLATSVPLAPGEHLYAIIEDGQWLLDPTVPTSGFHDDQEVSWVNVADCSTPGLQVDDATGSADGGATIHATFLASTALAPMTPRRSPSPPLTARSSPPR